MSTIDTIDTTGPVEPKRSTIPPRGLVRHAWESEEAWEFRSDNERERREHRLAALAELAELIDTHDLAVPDVNAYSFADKVSATWDVGDEDTFRELRRAIGSTIDSPWIKETAYGQLRVERDYTPRLRVIVRATWGTCEKVTVGTKTVERSVDACPDCESELVELDSGGQACADDECAYEVRPPKRVTREVEEPIEEWRCPEVADL